MKWSPLIDDCTSGSGTRCVTETGHSGRCRRAVVTFDWRVIRDMCDLRAKAGHGALLAKLPKSEVTDPKLTHLGQKQGFAWFYKDLVTNGDIVRRGPRLHASRTGLPASVRFSNARLRMRASAWPQRSWGSPRTLGAAMDDPLHRGFTEASYTGLYRQLSLMLLSNW